MVVSFSHYLYMPCLQCSEAEHMAYEYLSDEDKSAILPILEISQVKYGSSFREAIDSIKKVVAGRPFILDLSKDRAPEVHIKQGAELDQKGVELQAAQNAYNSEQLSHLDPYNGFEAWRKLSSEFPSSIPTLQFTAPEKQAKQILRQAAKFEKSDFSQMAIRINQETSDEIYSVIGQVIAILNSASQLLVVLDCGQGRQGVSERADFVKKALSRISEEIDLEQAQAVVAVCMHDGFTSLAASPLKVHEMKSREVWAEACDTFPFVYGDYGAHHRRKSRTTFIPSTWKAQVVYPLSDKWIVYQHPNAQDANGWIQGAKEIVTSKEFDGVCSCWGSDLLDKAAKGQISGVDSARYWYAAKINMHIHRQIAYSSELADG